MVSGVEIANIDLMDLEHQLNADIARATNAIDNDDMSALSETDEPNLFNMGTNPSDNAGSLTDTPGRLQILQRATAINPGALRDQRIATVGDVRKQRALEKRKEQRRAAEARLQAQTAQTVAGLEQIEADAATSIANIQSAAANAMEHQLNAAAEQEELIHRQLQQNEQQLVEEAMQPTPGGGIWENQPLNPNSALVSLSGSSKLDFHQGRREICFF